MASTSDGRRLTEAHRVDQIRIRNAVAARLLDVWPLLDPTDLDATTERWLDASTPIVRRGAVISGARSESYYPALRAVELRRVERLELPDVELPSLDQVRTSLLVRGPVAIKERTARGVPLARNVELSRVEAVAAGARHAQGAGRRYLTQAVAADRRAYLWSRVTAARPCGFCAMLASRGAVYVSRESAGDDEQWHDRCGCTVEPGFRDGAVSASAERWGEQWEQAKIESASSGEETRLVFRRAVEAA